MADQKISALPAATTPLDGTEVAPIVQSSTTKKVAVSEFVNSKNTFTRLQTSNGSNASPVTQDGFIFQTSSIGGRAGFKFTNRNTNNSSQTLEAWTSNTSNTYAIRFRIDQNGYYQWGAANEFTANYGNYQQTQSNHYKIEAGNNGLGFATDTNTQWLNFYNFNTVASPDNIARIEVTATNTNNTVEAGYMSIYTRSGASSTAPLETAKFNANGDITASRGNVVMATAGKGLQFSGNGNVTWACGAGTPEGAVTAPVGSLFTRTDGGASTTLYVKESGTGNTGWVAK